MTTKTPTPARLARRERQLAFYWRRRATGRCTLCNAPISRYDEMNPRFANCSACRRRLRRKARA